MASLTRILASDPTLDAADRAMEALSLQERPRSYLGMSQIGESCARQSWYRYRFVKREAFDVQTLKRFEDGHRTEALVIERLKRVEGITLIDIDPTTGQQIGFIDHDGHFRGHADGSIIGLIQAPKALHVFEAKCCSEKKLNELKKAVADLGEKAALKKWNSVYYSQGMLYCHYLNATRHYLVVATPGGRDWISVRTDADEAHALVMKAKAKRVISSHEPLDRISDRADWFECRYCTFSGICHNADMPARNCRTCLHSTPVENGAWHCARWGKLLTVEEQVEGCPAQIFLPSLIPGEIVSATETSVTYRFKDGNEWTDSEAK